MIINLLINVFLLFIGFIFYIFPDVTISSIPYIGEELASILYTMTITWNAFIETVPYLELPWTLFLYVVIPFEILLLLGKVFLGSRLPTNNSIN